MHGLDARRGARPLVDRGVAVSPIRVHGPDGLRDRRPDDVLDNVGFVHFSDPDGNRWVVQQISARGGL